MRSSEVLPDAQADAASKTTTATGGKVPHMAAPPHRAGRQSRRGPELAPEQRRNRHPGQRPGQQQGRENWQLVRCSKAAMGYVDLAPSLIAKLSDAEFVHWQASAAINLPGSISKTYSSGLNGFESRCCAYGVALAVLTEIRLPDAAGKSTVWFPEGYSRRQP